MNKQIGFIELPSGDFAEKNGYSKITYYQEVTDERIHIFISKIKGVTPQIQKIVIPVRLGEDSNYLGLKFGLHLRLTKELGVLRFIPIIFVSVETRNEIIADQIENDKEKTATLLFTPGVKLVTAFELHAAIDSFNETINESILAQHVLPKLMIANQRELGHQLANEWGVFRLAKFAGIDLKDLQLPSDLYFKYQFTKTDLNLIPDGKPRIGLEPGGCNALLIDDQAEKGWQEVVLHILKSRINQHSSTLKSLTTYEDANNYTRYEDHDIVFLDLRLKPEEDRAADFMAIEDLSGYKLLGKIKTINRGIQVIVLTASNKAWNMKKMLDEGADGYFIKESPDVPISDEASRENYTSLVKAINRAFQRKYLRNIFQEARAIYEKLMVLKENGIYDEDFLNELGNQIDTSLDMHYNAKSKEQFAYAFVTLYLAIEILNKQQVDPEGISQNPLIKKWKLSSGEYLLNWQWNPLQRKYTSSQEIEDKNKPPEWVKLAGLYFQEWRGTDHSFITKIYHQINMRNHFIHKDSNLNQDIFIPKAFIELFSVVKKIISML